MERDDAAPGGFRDDQLGRRRSTGSSPRSGASRPTLRRRRVRHAVGRLAHQREELPRRQVRPPRAAHRQPRLQRPLLHGVGRRRRTRRRSASTATPNPWSDIPLADVVWVAGSNVAETFPITTSYIWRARDRGAKLIVQDPRVVPLARTADLFLPVRPGTDSALFGAVLHELIRTRLARPRVHRRPHRRLRRGRRGRRRHDAGVGGRHHRRARRRASSRPPSWWGTSATGMMLHARGIEQQTKGVDNVLAAINLGLATGKFGKPGCGVVDDHRAGQRPGRARARPQVRPAARQPRHHQPRAPRPRRRGVGLRRVARSPARASPPRRSSRRSTTARSRGCCRSASTRRSRRPTRNFTAEALDKLEFYAVIDFFLSESAHHADVVLPGSLHEEDEGTSTSGEGRIIKINAAVDAARRGPRATGRSCSTSPSRLGKGEYFPYTNTERDLRGAAPRVGRRHRRLPRRHVAAHRGRDGPVLADPRGGPPGTPRLFEGGQFYHPDGKARFHAVPYRDAGRGGRRRVPGLADHRPGRQPVPVGHADPAHRRRSSSSTRSRCARCTRSSPSRSASPTATSSPSPPAAARSRCRPTSSTRSGPTPCSSRTTGPARKAANQLTNRAVDPLSKMPEFKVAAVRVERAGGHAATTDARDLELHGGRREP